MILLAILVAAAIVAAVAGIVAFNRLIRYRNLVADGWAGIDVQLTRRAEL
ncbi:MAG: LemA family protein, partial [Actinobacteria bacterium]|nr:LemA family protein [Actinomycetota bacterium]